MKALSYGLALGLCASLLWSCEREQIDNTDNGYPIELEITQIGNQVSLSWPEANISSFVEYRILRSPDSIPDELTQNVTNATIAGRILNYEEVEFLDDEVPFANRLYYKLLVDIGDRFLLSPTIAVDFDRTLLDISFSTAWYAGTGDQLYIHDAFGTGDLHRYDLKKKEVAASKYFSNNFQAKLSLGEYDGKTELYLFDPFLNTFGVWDEMSLAFVQSWNPPYGLTDVVRANNFLFLAVDDWNYPIRVSQRANFDQIEQVNLANGSVARNLTILQEDPNGTELLSVSSRSLERLQFDAQGQHLDTEVETSSDFREIVSETIFSPDGQYFIPYRFGGVYTTSDLQLFGNFGDENDFFQEFAFAPEGDRLFALNSFTGIIEEYSFPELERIGEINLEVNVREIFVYENQLVLIGITFLNGFSQTYLEFIPL
ncbi:MAG: hypothetical protein AAF399_07115 [Bacteroidota bacterium]